MRHVRSIASIAGMAVLCLCGESLATLKYHNGTPNTLFSLDAFASTSGFGCGFDDGCSGVESQASFPPGYRVRGWFQIAPGGTATVEGHAFHNAKHDGFAQDQFGHVWQGGGHSFCISTDVQNHCGSVCPGSAQVTFPVFFSLSRTNCCGITCSPENFTMNFTL